MLGRGYDVRAFEAAAAGPGVKWDPKRMPTDWQGNWGAVAMVYHLGELTRDQYNQLHKAAHRTGGKL